MYSSSDPEKGAVVVEFAFMLIFFFFFFLIFMQVAGIFLAHEQLSFATFVASRSYSVNNPAEARNAVIKIDRGTQIQIEPKNSNTKTISVSKTLEVPIDLNNLGLRGWTGFPIQKEIKTFIEPSDSGDSDN